LGKKKLITLIVHNLQANPIVRAYPIALALKKLGYNVEIVGFLIGKKDVYKPYANKFNYKTIYLEKESVISYLFGLSKILKLIKGDIIYAFKPLWTTFFLGLLASGFGFKKTILLDVEDDELFFSNNNKSKFDSILHFFFRGWNGLNSYGKLLFLHLLLFFVKKITVVSSKLRKRYGGDIILHGPSEIIFNPNNYNKFNSRREFNLPQDKILILFAGIPHKHKGIHTIVSALKSMGDEFIFVAAGPKNHIEYVKAKKILKEKCILLGLIDNSQMPSLLSAVDITPILQMKTVFTESQMPAKLFESMSMGKTIIATNTSDIANVLEGKKHYKRGFIVDFNDVNQFKETLNYYKKNKESINQIQKNAMEYFMNEASVNANAKKLLHILNNKNESI